MRLRKTVAILMSVLMLLLQTAYADYDNLSATGIGQRNLSGEAGEPIFRDEFAFLVSKLLSSVDRQPVDTVYEDVKETNQYSGYVAYLSHMGIINGISATEFAPSGHVSRAAAAKILVHMLRFDEAAEKLGGYPNGYMTAAVRLGLFEGISQKDGDITRDEALRLLDNSLLVVLGNEDLQPSVYSSSVVRLKESKENKLFLTHLGYSVYEGVIESYNFKSGNMNFSVRSNEYQSNAKLLELGSTVNLYAASGIDLSHWEKVPVQIWTNSDDEVVHIKALRGYEVRYSYIESVNGDEDKTGEYNTDSINRITLVGDDEEYEFYESYEIALNGAVRPRVALAGSFAKLIFKDDKLIYIGAWKTAEGGIVEKTNSGELSITYKQSESGGQVMDDIAESERVLVYIDGRRATFSEIKPNSVFSYYKSAKTTVITVCERTATGVFDAMTGSDIIVIDGFLYDIENCRFSTDGIRYKQGNTWQELLGKEVFVYFSPDANAAYVRPSYGEAVQGSFYGVVKNVIWSEDKEEYEAIRLFVVGSEVEEKEYPITDKTRYHNGLNISTVVSNAKNLNGDGVYYFTLNSKGVISDVEKCTPFTGYGTEAKATVTVFTDEVTPVVTIGSKQLYFDGTDIIALCTEDGQFTAKKVDWLSIYGRTVSGGASLNFYSKEEEPQPEIAIMCGSIDELVDKGLGLGVVLEKKIALNENGEAANLITVLDRTGKKEYFVSDRTAARVSENSFISFSKRSISSEEQLIISEVVDISGNIGDWPVSLSTTTGLQRGVVRRIDEKRLYLEASDTNEVYFMHPYASCVIMSESGANKTFEISNVKEINVGDTVCYYLYGGEIRAIIGEK